MPLRHHADPSVEGALLQTFSVRGFRNLAPLDLELPPGLIALLGPNGAGKTNFLEAVTVFGNLLSFRPAPTSSWVRRGETGFVLSGTVQRAGTPVELTQQARLDRSLHRSLFRGARKLGPAEYLSLFPVAAFSSHDRLLVWGPPEERRRFLDRVAFSLHAETLPVIQRYRRALQQRNALLVRGGREAELDAFEQDLATLGSRLVAYRLEAVAALEARLPQELTELGWLLSRPNLRYHDPDGLASDAGPTLVGELRARLARGRREERARGHTLIGPHRHDLRVSVAGAPAREAVSSGQGKLLATACKLAAMAVFEEVRGQVPVVVFDDVDAELDARVLERVLGRLGGARQAILSSAHEDLMLARLPDAAAWRMSDGTVFGPPRGSLT